MLNFNLLTLFPEFFASPLKSGLLARAVENGLLRFNFVNPRSFAENRHGHIDDRPYGGGPGMIMRVEPLERALQSIGDTGPILLLSAKGQPFDQKMAEAMAESETLTLICGRYEGIDERLEEMRPVTAVSVGNAVLNGGECAALAIIEAVARLTPGFMGREESADEESFSSGILEYPQYTRPEEFAGLKVPSILLSGDHGRIATWRREKALELTLRKRPELLARARLTADDARFLSGISRLRLARNCSFCLAHYPVFLEPGKIGTSSLTNLDVHDIGRISCGYQMGAFYVLTPLQDQLRLLDEIISYWTLGAGAIRNKSRKNALSDILGFSSLDEILNDIQRKTGRRPLVLSTSAHWPDRHEDKELLSPADVLRLCEEYPVLICLGTARGLTPEFQDACDGQIRPLRFLNDNHLSVRSAAAILADRIFGDFY